jgi:hypothetical protein
MNWRYQWPQLQNGYLERAGIDIAVTCTSPEEDEFPSVRREGSKENRALHEIDQRVDKLDDAKRAQHKDAKQAVEADRAFNDALNGALQEADLQPEALASEDETETAHVERQHRLVGFFRNMSQRLHHMKEQVPEIARDWRARFDGAQERLSAWIGHRQAPPDGEDGLAQPPEEPKL